MPDVLLRRTTGPTLVPVGDDARSALDALPLADYWVTIRRSRNPMFHRKMMKLFRIAFDMFDERFTPIQYHGEEVRPDFDRFRKDITIIAGFFRAFVDIEGTVTYEAKSLAYDQMEEDEFRKCYDAVVGVILDRVMTNYTREDVDRLLEFIE